MTTPVVDVSIVPTIEVGNTASDVVNVDGRTIFGIYTPLEFSGAVLKFKSGLSSLDSMLAEMRDEDGDALSITIAAPEGDDLYGYTKLSGISFAGVQFLQIVSDTVQATEDAQFILAVRPI